MNLFKKLWVSILGVAAFMSATSFILPVQNKTATGKLSIQFQNYIGSELLQLDSTVYKNSIGQDYTISKFRYYISNIRLKKADGTAYISREYFLVDEEEINSQQIVLKSVPEGDYSSVSFILGVDSLHNCSGAQSGALDPMHGMFWAWNTGYIFLKLEGHSPASTSPGHILEFHIGGYKQPANCIRQISLELKNKTLSIKLGTNPTLRIKTDASEILKSPVAIDFSQSSSVTDFHNAEMIADNYTDMFSILSAGP